MIVQQPAPSALADYPNFDELVCGVLKHTQPSTPKDLAELLGRGHGGDAPSWQAVHRALERLNRQGRVRLCRTHRPKAAKRWELNRS